MTRVRIFKNAEDYAEFVNDCNGYEGEIEVISTLPYKEEGVILTYRYKHI